MTLSWKVQAFTVCYSVIAIRADATRHQGAFLFGGQNTWNHKFLTAIMKAAKRNQSKENNNINDDEDKKQQQHQPTKQIVFVRHSTTYMNEYLGRSLSFGAPKFSDVFNSKDLPLYRDTPLSPRGIQLVQNTLARHCPAFCKDDDLNLVVISPLRRALQTFHIGLRPHLSSFKSEIPVVVLPEAAERLYLISDVGTPMDQLEKEYGYMDFGEIKHENRNAWWWTPPNSAKNGNDPKTSTSVEWRPIGQGQRYACPGEPQADFDARMLRLYQWLDNRSESKIAVVCHHGVIEWMLDMDFDNCQWRAVDFDKIRPLAMHHNMSSSSYY
jgi:broad specificity phosphatase PhoE